MEVLYATDGSHGAQAAGRMLSHFPLPPGSRINVVTVATGEDETKARVTLDAALALLEASAAETEGAVVHGHVVQEILRAADDVRADLLVVGASGHSAIARFLLGTVTERVARHARCPVLVVRNDPGPLRAVLLAVDHTAGANRAAAWLREFPIPEGCAVRIMTVARRLDELIRVRTMQVMPAFTDEQLREHAERVSAEAQEHLDALSEEFEAAGKRASTWVQFGGDPAEGILDAARKEDAGLIVLGDEPHSALERYFMGHVTEPVLRHAGCAVLIVRDHKPAA